MTPKPLRLALALCCAAAVLPMVASAQEDVIKQRQAGFDRMSAHSRSIRGLLDDGGKLPEVAARAQDMQRFFQGVPALFPAGATGGKATPAIWSDRTGFEANVADALNAATRLASAAQSGDASAAGTAFRELGASCGACHRAYRAR